MYKITKGVEQCILINWASPLNRNNGAFYLIRTVAIAMDLLDVLICLITNI